MKRVKNKTELLAPSKNKETAFAAIESGADAVYMGASSFGARKNAPNSLDDINEVIKYAHKFGVKVYITINTILTDSELEEAKELIKKLYELKADAIIIQDMGLLKAAIDGDLPPIPIHIRSQCDNYLPSKVKFFNDIGVSRVILARELSFEQIKKIHEENPELELEAFIHGALCVSYSGQCYLSQYVGGRSANRGECAQPCRRKYSVITNEGKLLAENYALCLKDMNASGEINEMIGAGICSFKIEGRLKDTNYVKNVVSFYRNLLPDKTSYGKTFTGFTPDPEKSFNRGFTTYFLKGRADCFNSESPKSRGKFIGKVITVKKDCFKLDSCNTVSVKPQDGLYFEGDGCLINKVENGYIYPNKNVNIKIGTKVFRNLDREFEKELSKPLKRQIGINLEVKENILKATDEEGFSVQVELSGQKPQKPQEDNFIKQLKKTGDSDFYIMNIKIESEIPFMPIKEINELRRNLFEQLAALRIKSYKNKLQKPMKYVKYFQDKVDFRANVLNKEAEAFYKLCGCEVTEPALEKEKPKRQIPLMRCKHCIKYALDMCKSPENISLKDEYGNIYPLRFDCKNCEMSVLSPL